MTGAGSDAATAWPRFSKGRRHVLQLSTGCAAAPWAQRAENERAALAILRDAVPRISGVDVHPPGDYLPNFMLPSLDAAAVFGANWEKVRRVKGRYDPLGKLYGGIAIPPLL
ncbi:hypothetical protein FH972_022029 [Carpinus fangiana]|uniref:Berberine/berberine-like domain-containing protein n=1 Tax=Carpinus fangiana TaxID=176857 RepID=A0A5N6KRK4_9ROSI|nr:hypothetical protein FH972_022029 [Carpinus fangiana]